MGGASYSFLRRHLAEAIKDARKSTNPDDPNLYAGPFVFGEQYRAFMQQAGILGKRKRISRGYMQKGYMGRVSDVINIFPVDIERAEYWLGFLDRKREEILAATRGYKQKELFPRLIELEQQLMQAQ